jgi:hypothetical protein
MVAGQIEWYLSRGGKRLGPFSQHKLDEMKRAGQLAPTDLVWRNGWPEWVPAERAFSIWRTAQPIGLRLKVNPHKKRRDRSSLVTFVVAFIGVAGALGGGLLSNWHSFFPSQGKKATSVEACDESLRPTSADGEFSGVYAGVVEDAQGRTDVQLMLVRNGNTVQGSYFRAGVCGKVFGEITQGRLIFNWSWAGGSGRGIASQEGTKLSASSGFDEATEGGGKLLFFQR